MKGSTWAVILMAFLVSAVLTGCGPFEQRLADGTAVAAGQQVDSPWFGGSEDGTGGNPGVIPSEDELNALATNIQAALDEAVQTPTLPPTNTIPPPEIPTTEPATPTLSTAELNLTALAQTLAVIESGTPTPTPEPTETVTATPVPGTPTPTEVPCLAFRFVAHVSYPPGTYVAASTLFYKSWQVQNVGTCTWNGAFALVHYDGFQLGGQTPLPLGADVAVAPGKYVTLTLPLWTPPQAGTYTSRWMMSDDSGTLFGGGAGQTEPLLVQVVVPGPSQPEFTSPASTAPPFYTNTPGP